MDFPAAPSRGGLVGALLVGGVGLLSAGCLALAFALGPGPAAAVLVLVAALLVPLLLRLAVWLWGCLSLTYSVSRDGIVVRWGAAHQVIPIGDITHVLNGRPYDAPLAGLRWPGHEVGRTTFTTDDGVQHPALVFATRPPEAQLFIVTPGLVYGISPADRAAFVEEFKIRSRLGSVQPLTAGTVYPGWVRWPFWHDGLALRLVGLGLALNLAVSAWLLWRYPELPALLPLQLAPAVMAEAMAGTPRPKAGIWWLPAVGLLAILLNAGLSLAVHHRVRLAAYLLLAGAILLQVVLALLVGQLV